MVEELEPTENVHAGKKWGLFFLKCLLILVLWQPLLILFIAIVAIGAIRLFYFGDDLDYPKTLKDPSCLKKGDILLVGKKSVTHSWYIQISNVLTRRLRHRFWTHAAVCAGDGFVWEAQPKGSKGIVKSDIRKYSDGGFVIRAFRPKYIKEEQTLDEVIRFCSEKENGYRYGWVGLLFYVFSTFVPVSFNWLFNDPIIDRLCRVDEAYFCSELIVDAYASTGHPISPFDGWRVKPADFISNPLLQPVEPIQPIQS